MASLLGTKNVAVNDRDDGLVLERKLIHPEKSPAPISASIMLFNCCFLISASCNGGGGDGGR